MFCVVRYGDSLVWQRICDSNLNWVFPCVELLRQETLGHNCVPYNAMSFQTSELHDLQIPDELPDQSVIRDLENFVQMNGDSGDIGKIMDYSDPNVSALFRIESCI